MDTTAVPRTSREIEIDFKFNHIDFEISVYVPFLSSK